MTALPSEASRLAEVDALGTVKTGKTPTFGPAGLSPGGADGPSRQTKNDAFFREILGNFPPFARLSLAGVEICDYS